MLKILIDYIRSPVTSRYAYITSSILLVSGSIHVFTGNVGFGYFGLVLGVLWFLLAMLKARKGK